MGYRSVPAGFNFSTEFPTYIIAYCPDMDDFFVTNTRFYYYEYNKEFNSYSEGESYFMNHLEEFFEIRKSMSDAIPYYYGHENELWFTTEDMKNIKCLPKENNNG